MVAIANADQTLCEQLRNAGASEPDMVPKTRSIQEAFTSKDFVEVLRRIAAGDDVNAKLSRGQGVQATSSGTPLHACCAMHQIPGSSEMAQFLIRKGADLAAGDAEGDTPLATPSISVLMNFSRSCRVMVLSSAGLSTGIGALVVTELE